MVYWAISLLLCASLTQQNPAGGEMKLKKATFAGGCFWCMEPPFERLAGVKKVISGYTGGTGTNPTYQTYAAQGHVEAIEVEYDPERVSYSELLDLFWRQIDPTDPGGQFVDRGREYRTAIFYQDKEEKRLAEESKELLDKSGRFSKPVVTEILKASEFYPAEDYHQDYYRKSALKYKFYRYRSGRNQFLKDSWENESAVPKTEKADSEYAKPSREELRKKLSPIQYRVTQEDDTEPPFQNTYWNNQREGIYVDIVSGEPLFSSLSKFKTGTGWPSFSRPLMPENIVEKADRELFSLRKEVRSRLADSHLGHVFPDGPPPTRLRYCINSAALRFIAKEDLEKEGYGEFLDSFEKR